MDLKRRLDDDSVVKGFISLIRHAPEETVREFQKNLLEHAADHPRMERLNKEFKERLGDE